MDYLKTNNYPKIGGKSLFTAEQSDPYDIAMEVGYPTVKSGKI